MERSNRANRGSSPGPAGKEPVPSRTYPVTGFPRTRLPAGRLSVRGNGNRSAQGLRDAEYSNEGSGESGRPGGSGQSPGVWGT